MYLIIYEENNYEIVRGYNLKYALQNFYEFVGGFNSIDKDMFMKMISPLSEAESVVLFNALMPEYTIEKIYKGLEEIEL